MEDLSTRFLFCVKSGDFLDIYVKADIISEIHPGVTYGCDTTDETDIQSLKVELTNNGYTEDLNEIINFYKI